MNSKAVDPNLYNQGAENLSSCCISYSLVMMYLAQNGWKPQTKPFQTNPNQTIMFEIVCTVEKWTLRCNMVLCGTEKIK